MLSNGKRKWVTDQNCLKFLTCRFKLNECLYFALRTENLADLCIIEDAIAKNQIQLLVPDSYSVLWLIFGALYKRNIELIDLEINVFNKVFDIFSHHKEFVKKSFFESIHFYDDNLVRFRGYNILKKCIIHRLTANEDNEWLLQFYTEVRILKLTHSYTPNILEELEMILKNHVMLNFLYIFELKSIPAVFFFN